MTDYTRPLHKIHIVLNKSNDSVIGYVSLFGTFRFTTLLSDNFVSQFEWPGLDYTFDPVRRKEIFGKEDFRAPLLSKDDVLNPKQSEETVLEELCAGQKIIENYIDELEFLGGEFK